MARPNPITDDMTRPHDDEMTVKLKDDKASMNATGYTDASATAGTTNKEQEQREQGKRVLSKMMRKLLDRSVAVTIIKPSGSRLITLPAVVTGIIALALILIYPREAAIVMIIALFLGVRLRLDTGIAAQEHIATDSAKLHEQAESAVSGKDDTAKQTSAAREEPHLGA